MGQPIYDKNGKVVFRVLSEDEFGKLTQEVVAGELAQQRLDDLAKGNEWKWNGTNGMSTAEVLAIFDRIEQDRKGNN